MPAMPMVTAAFVPGVPTAAMSYRRAAFRAHLPMLAPHASSDFLFIRNEFAAKLQRIVLTDLARVALGGGAVDAGYDHSDSQHQCQSHKMDGPHSFPPISLTRSPRAGAVGGAPYRGPRRPSMTAFAGHVNPANRRNRTCRPLQCPRPQANSVWWRPDESRGQGATLPATS